MNRRVIILGAALLTSGCNEILGLGGDFSVPDSSGGRGGAGGAPQGGQSSSSGGAPTTSVGTSTAGGTGSSAPLEATCEEYCATIDANCTGANAEYQATICPVMCGQLAKGHVGDTTGDTVGCRLTKAKLAEADPVTYCQQAGPLGADGCAEPCDAFCTMLFATCLASESAPFASFPDCQQQCAEIEYLRLARGGSDLTTTTGKNLNCWLYHLQVANTPSNPNAWVHCNHIGPMGQCL